MKYLYLIVFTYILVGCSTSAPRKIKIYDLVHIPQNVETFSKYIKEENSSSRSLNNYKELYFKMWNLEKTMDMPDNIEWAFKAYKYGKSYGENLQLLKKSFFDKMYNNSNFNQFCSVSRRAITLKYSNIRAFPTIKPLFKNPKEAGEGFPFDYLQTSSIEANKPIFVSHYSKDRRWVYIFSSFTSGWLKRDEIVFLNKKFTNLWQKKEQVFFIKEGIPIYDKYKHFLFTSRIGMMLPLISEDKTTYTVLTVSTNTKSKSFYVKAKISKQIVHKGILKFNANNINIIINNVLKSNYGWGGIYEQRDCSSSLRDIFTPFGLWLPRNSSKQAKIGLVTSLKNLSNDKKIEMIRKKAIPFKTFLYMNGHILLYVGIYNNKIIVFHNIWGIKTMHNEKEGRIIIGKPIFSTLQIGSHQKYYDKNSELLKKLKSMNNINL